MKYDPYKHKNGIEVKNIKTGRVGRVEVRETYHEYIEPFVDYGDGQFVREFFDNLEVVDVHESKNAKK